MNVLGKTVSEWLTVRALLVIFGLGGAAFGTWRVGLEFKHNNRHIEQLPFTPIGQSQALEGRISDVTETLGEFIEAANARMAENESITASLGRQQSEYIKKANAAIDANNHELALHDKDYEKHFPRSSVQTTDAANAASAIVQNQIASTNKALSDQAAILREVKDMQRQILTEVMAQKGHSHENNANNGQ